MQKGHMRFEPNINLHITRDGQVYKTPITEVKNLNSFRAIERSVAYEIQRQLDEFIETGKTLQMGNKKTFGWDDAISARSCSGKRKRPTITGIFRSRTWFRWKCRRNGWNRFRPGCANCRWHGRSDISSNTA